MEKDLYTILCSDINNPRSDLAENICLHVHAYNARRGVVRLWVSIALGVASIALLVPAVADMSVKFRQSGFYEYTSLLLSDGGKFSTYGKDFAIALGESIPTWSIIIFLVIVVVLLWSVRNIFKQSKYQYLNLSVN